MSKFLLYGKIGLILIFVTIIGMMVWQNYNLQNRLDSALEEIGNLSGALDTQSITIDQLNNQMVVTQQNMQIIQEETSQIEVSVIEEERKNMSAVDSAYTETTEESSRIITERTNELFRTWWGE